MQRIELIARWHAAQGLRHSTIDVRVVCNTSRIADDNDGHTHYDHGVVRLADAMHGVVV